MKTLIKTLAVLTTALMFHSHAEAGYVSKYRRDLVVVINLVQTDSNLAPFYSLVEFGAESMVMDKLGSKYHKIHVLKGYRASRYRLAKTLKTVTGWSRVKAVDLIYVTHGLGNRIYFHENNYLASDVGTYIRNRLTPSRRAKLRAVFSTACYGSRHRDAWLNAGFKVATGSKRIYADSALSFGPLLDQWRNNKPFFSAVLAANVADPLRINDAAAKPLLHMAGIPLWWDVNSYRISKGNVLLKISSSP